MACARLNLLCVYVWEQSVCVAELVLCAWLTWACARRWVGSVCVLELVCWCCKVPLQGAGAGYHGVYAGVIAQIGRKDWFAQTWCRPPVLVSHTNLEHQTGIVGLSWSSSCLYMLKLLPYRHSPWWFCSQMSLPARQFSGARRLSSCWDDEKNAPIPRDNQYVFFSFVSFVPYLHYFRQPLM